MEDIAKVIALETAKQREDQADTPLWNVIFATADEFDRADRASRAVKSESLVDFCRAVILKRSDEILEEKKRSRYPVAVKPATKVAEGKRK